MLPACTPLAHMQETVSLIWDSPEAGLPRALIRPLRIDATWQKPTKTKNSSFSITAQPFENRCDLTKIHKNTKNVFFKIMPRPLKIDVTCKKINETCGFSVFFYFRNHRISLCIYTKLSNFTKKLDFSVLWLKGYCVTKMFFVFFSKLFISWNHKLNWLTRTWNFMDFFSWDAMPQARGMFLIFWIYRICPGLRPSKSIKNKKTHFFQFFVFFSSFWEIPRGWQTF